MPERGAELQSWVVEEDNKGAAHSKETSLWWGPLIGVTDQLELALPVGGEVYAELSLDDKEDSWVVAGPDLSWTHGRFWLTATFGIGVYNITAAPRFMWGIAF